MHKKLFFLTPHLVIEEEISESFYKTLKKREDVVHINRSLDKDVILKTEEGLSSGAVSRGLTTKDMKKFLHQFPKDSENVDTSSSLQTMELSAYEVLLASDLAYSLNVFQGDEIIVSFPEFLLMPSDEIPYYETFYVRGFIPTEVASLYSQHIFYNSEHSFQPLIQREGIYYEKKVDIRLKDPYQYLPLYLEIKAKGKKVSSWKERHSSLFFALKMEKWAMTLFLSLSVLIMSFSIFTLLMLLISQKRKDIGMLMTMGVPGEKIRQIFTQIGLWISLLGVGIGVIFGLIIAFSLYFFPLSLLPAKLYYDSLISAQVNIKFVFSVVLFSFFIAFLGSRIAAELYINLSPTEALQGKKRSL